MSVSPQVARFATVTPDDRRHLARALALAERGRATVRPNPLVGCVIVRDGVVVGEGWHERAGGPHAEVVAIAAAGPATRGATAYVTLEPCDHHGRTGPCSEALIAAGVARVVYGHADPDAAAAGGAARLRGAGIDVEGGVLAGWVAVQNDVFLTAVTTGRPHVTCKLALTAAGELTHPDRRWITGPVARREVHRLRASVDAILVGSGTVVTDDPRLDARDVAVPLGQPRPVVVDARGRTGPEAAIVRAGTVIVTRPDHDPAWAASLRDRGVTIVAVPAAPAGVDLRATLTELYARGIRAVLCEGGGTLADALVRAGLVDRLILHVADPSVSVAAGVLARLAGTWRVTRSRALGADVELVGRPLDAAIRPLVAEVV